MFSGIVETTSRVLKIQDSPGQRIVTLAKPRGWKLSEGESISVEGVCSTVQRKNEKAFEVTYMPETLRRTTLGDLEPNDPVNLERSLTLQSLIGGHLLQGHVDSAARIRKIRSDAEARIYEFEIEPRVSHYIVPQGSVAVDGISLTVVDSRRGFFTTSLLAYTLARTTLGGKGRGDRVNVEVDILAKYIEKLIAREEK